MPDDPKRVNPESTDIQRRLIEECAQLDADEEWAYAEEGMGCELERWPEYRVLRPNGCRHPRSAAALGKWSVPRAPLDGCGHGGLE